MPSAEHRTPPDLVESLLDAVVQLPDADQEAALAERCAAHPQLAAALRERFSLFRRLRGGDDTPPGDGPRRFGDYELLRELGRGGMGVVHLARQHRGDQQRLVALKLVRDRLLLSPQARERLRREGAAAFRLDHPGICRAYDLGEIDGTPFVSMRYVPGRTLAALLADARAADRLPELPTTATDETPTGGTSTSCPARVAAALWLAEQVARALHTAHEAGFVHRDVKPGNVMVGDDGAPVLLDFGLVQDERETHALTLTDQPLGTPTYMSPEQIEPRGRRAERTTDVWSLGATLFELLAGEPPFTGNNREELFRRILADAPPRLPRRLGVPRDVEVVLRTALEKEPARRYPTALAFAEDLRRARLLQPIAAAPPSLARRLLLWSRRNPLAAAMLALLALSQAVIVGLALHADERAAEARAAQAEALADYTAAEQAMDELTEVARQHLTDVPWLETVRRALFAKVLAFHERAAARRPLDAADRQRAASTQLLAAHLHEDLGEDDRAQQLAAAAVATLADTTDPQGRRWHAHGQQLLATLARKRGDTEAAEAAFDRAIATLRELAATPTATTDDRLRTAQCLMARAELLEGRAGRRDDAQRTLEEGLALTADSREPQLRLEHAAALRLRARLRRVDGDPDAATADLQQSRDQLRELVRAEPHDREARAQLGATLLALGLAQRHAHRDADALVSYDEAQATHEALVAAFPFVCVYRTNLAHVHNNRSVVLRQLGRNAEAGQALARAIEIANTVVADQPDNVESRQLVAGCAFNLANQLRDNDPARATALYRDSMAQLAAVLQKLPDDRRALDLASRVATSLGALLARDGKRTEALAVFVSARQLTTRLLDGHGYDPQARRNAAILYNNAGSLACELGDQPQAMQFLTLAVRCGEGLVAESPADVPSLGLLLDHRVRSAIVQELHDPAGARATWQAAVDGCEGAPPAARERLLAIPLSRFDFASALRGLATSSLRAGDPTTAAPLLTRAAATLLEDGGIGSAVEALLLARDRAVCAAAAADASLPTTLAALRTAATTLAPRLQALGTDTLHVRRVRASWAFVDEALPELGRAPLLEALAPLAAAVGR